MFYSTKKAELINYADDNTVTTIQPTQKLVVDLLQVESRVAIGEDHVKLLGVNLDSKLNFEIHIQQICFKAGNYLNLLKRLSPFINCKDRMAIFRRFILCHFEFCSVVLHF